MNNSDNEWRAWGERDPYFAVLTNPIYRRANIDDGAKKKFFASGQEYVDYILHRCRRFIDPNFEFKRALDFGCGVGRILLPLARIADEVVGVDISPAMLAEARVRSEAEGLSEKVALVESDDGLTRVEGQFDLVHCYIVLQHIEIHRGRAYFERLVDLVQPGGTGVIQLTYAKMAFADNFGRPPAPVAPPAAELTLLDRLRRGVEVRDEPAPNPAQDPHMQMNTYPLNDVMFILQSRGVKQVHLEFTDHGGELGTFIFFKRPPTPPPKA